METDVAQVRELGRELARIRELAELTQADLAKRLGVSQTVVSRTETGERQMESDELQRFAEAIGTEEARGMVTRISRVWSELSRPPLGHPDHDLLWTAEGALRGLRALLGQPAIAQAFARRIESLCDEIEAAAGKLLKRECSLVFIGKIGVGKTSAICHIADLVVARRGSPRPTPVLDVGAGRTTLCEVHIRTGPTSIVVEPCTDAEMRAHVEDFADKLLYAIMRGDNKGAAQDDQIMSREVERAIRNMADLRRPSRGDVGPDPARELARRVAEEELERGGDEQGVARRLQFEIESRVRTDLRRRLNMQWDEGTGQDHLQWLRSEFHRINIGDNPEFPIPRRIEVFVNGSLLPDAEGVAVNIVDTKGLDETVARADIEKHVGASHTVLVLCSGFNEAPGTEATNLLRRASEAGMEGTGIQGVALGLPKFDEALHTLDDAGETVESIEVGYRIKTEIVEETVHQSLGFGDISVSFLNSHEDDPGPIRRALSMHIDMVFQSYRNTVDELVMSSGRLTDNYQDEQAQEVVRQAAEWVMSWINKNRIIDLSSIKKKTESSLLDHVRTAYAATIHATMRRKGGWPNLDYRHQLGYGARLVVSSVLGPRVRSFGDLCDTFLESEEHLHAQTLLSQVRRSIERAFQEVTERVRLIGEMGFHNSLEGQDEFWGRGVRRWGGGPGYVEEIWGMNRLWFSNNGALNEEVEATVSSEWKHALVTVLEMLEGE